jgi:manganese/zinc/iron transport system ATP- binding protein
VNSGEPAVTIRNLSVAYGDRLVLDQVALDVQRGALTAMVGPNGAGKTTLIQTILGLVRPIEGEVHILGQPARDGRRQIAYVPQRGSVDWDFPASVLDVVLMGTFGSLGWFRRPGA